MSFVKNHPFAVEAFFDASIVLTYAVPKGKLETLIPACLKLDSFQDKWAFLAVAMVSTKNLRPKGSPRFMGNNFFLVGYRIFVQYITSDGKRLRGLYILKSETDKGKMVFAGNILTHYSYTKTDIVFERNDPFISIYSKKSNLNVKVQTGNENSKLPVNSPFASWKEARRFAGPLPFTFTYNQGKKEVLIVEGVRENWVPQPLEVLEEHVGFIEELGLKDVVLANAFIVENIPYYWKKGRIDKWKQ